MSTRPALDDRPPAYALPLRLVLNLLTLLNSTSKLSLKKELTIT